MESIFTFSSPSFITDCPSSAYSLASQSSWSSAASTSSADSQADGLKAQPEALLQTLFPPAKFTFSSFYFQAILELDAMTALSSQITHLTQMQAKKTAAFDILNKLHDKMLSARRFIWRRQTQNHHRLAFMGNSLILPPPPPQSQLALAWRQKPLTSQASELCDQVASMVLDALAAVNFRAQDMRTPESDHAAYHALMSNYTDALYRFRGAIRKMVDYFGKAIAGLSPAVTRSLGNVALAAYEEAAEMVRVGTVPGKITSIDLPYFYDEFDIKKI